MNPNDPSLRSFIDVAPDGDFPIQNLPYGVFSTADAPTCRVGVAIGDQILDLAVLDEAGLLPAQAKGAFAAPALNPFMALGQPVWSATRAAISALLRHDAPRLRDDAELRARALVSQSAAQLHLPIRVEGFTDFYSSREHATNVGAMFRGRDNALMPNWLRIPIGYNGRASTIVVSGTPIRRPSGQIKLADHDEPIFGACRKLDIELEIGMVVGQATTMGDPIGTEAAQAAIFGFCLLNDWSARDIQQWEYVPLGPFQAKAFATTIAPWIVPAEALEPFRVEGPAQEPAPLPYLRQPARMNYDLQLAIDLQPAKAERATTVSHSNFRYMYWSSAQQLAHHTSSGCRMSVGDLLGSGTISGPGRDEVGSLLELTMNGAEPVTLETGEKRGFLEDGDRVTLRGWCQGPSYRIGFGACSGEILPARIPAGWSVD
jgi:fumarylacetoacetase